MSWDLLIDFDRSNSFTSYIGRVRSMQWSLGFAPYEHLYRDTPAKIIVNNDDRQFSPEYNSSLKIGAVVKIIFDSALQYLGIITDYAPSPLRYADKTCIITAQSLKRMLDMGTFYPKLHEGKRADEVLYEYVLSAGLPPTGKSVFIVGHPIYGVVGSPLARIGDPADVVDAETGVLTFDYLGDNIQGVTKNPELFSYADPLQANRNRTTVDRFIRDIVEAERGYFFVGKDGKWYFKNRYWLIDNVTIAETFDNDTQGMSYITPWGELYNQVAVTYYPRKESATANEVLWQLDEAISLSAGEGREIQAIYADGVGAKDVQTPSGADFVVSSGSASISITAAAQRAKLTITATTAATISTIVLRGRTITSENTQSVIKTSTTSTRATMFVKPLELNLRLVSDFATAEEIAELELRRRTDAKGRVGTITLEGRPTSASDTQITRNIGDRIRVKDHQTNHDGQYHITAIEQSVGEDQWLRTVFHLQKATLNRIGGVAATEADTDYSLRTSSYPHYQAFGQSVSIGVDTSMALVRFRLRKVGTVSGTLTVSVYDSRDLPSGLFTVGSSAVGGSDTIAGSDTDDYPDESSALATGTYNAADIGTSYEWIEFDLSAEVTIDSGVTYWLVLTGDYPASDTNYIQLAADSGASYSGGFLRTKRSSWSVTAHDAVFEAY